MIQQPFYLRFEKLYISDDIAKSLAIVSNENGTYNDVWFFNNIKRTKMFFDGTRYDSKYKGYKVNYLQTSMSVTFKGVYKMSILVYRGNEQDNEHGFFKYYVGGISGDSEMHGKNMIRATRECNLNFIYNMYPFTKSIKNLKKRIKETTFYDIISNSLKNKELLFSDLPTNIQKDIRKMKLNKLINDSLQIN